MHSRFILCLALVCSFVFASCSSDDACESNVRASGVVDTSVNAIDYTGQSVIVALHHKLDVDPEEDGCISIIDMTLSQGGQGCQSRLRFEGSPTCGMVLTEASLAADSFCPGWLDTDEGLYRLATGYVSVEFLSDVPDSGAEVSCMPSARMTFRGNVVLSDGSRTIDVSFDQLAIEGTFRSAGDTALSCPGTVDCEGRDCGPHPICGEGTSCGSCGDGLTCNADGRCMFCADYCIGRECGPDGCGGTCPPGCPEGQSCVDTLGSCVFDM